MHLHAFAVTLDNQRGILHAIQTAGKNFFKITEAAANNSVYF